MLNRRQFFIREHVRMLERSDIYDILDPETQEQIGIAKERPGLAVDFLRSLINKRRLPTQVYVYSGNDSDDTSALVFSIRRGFSFFRSRVNIVTRDGEVAGWFKSELFWRWLGDAFFRVFDASGMEVGIVKGAWKGWSFLDGQNNELGTITKKWAGIGKALFTSADNYMISISVEPDTSKSMLLLAAGLAIDIVYEE